MSWSIRIDDDDDNSFADESDLAGYIVYIRESLNGHEEAKIRIANTAANRTMIGADHRIQIKWDGTVIWTGVVTGAEYSQKWLDIICYNIVWEEAQRRLFTGDYTTGDTDTNILTAIAAVLTNGAAGTTSGATEEVRFSYATCMNSIKYLGAATNQDWWTGDENARGTNVTNINYGSRGNNKGDFTGAEIAISRRIIDRATKRSEIVVIGTDADGLELAETTGASNYEMALRVGSGKSSQTLLNMGAQEQDRWNTNTVGTKITLSIVDGHDLYPGDTITLANTELAIPSTSYRIMKTEKKVATVDLEIENRFVTIEEMLGGLKNWESVGIFGVGDLPLSMQGWNSDVEFSHGADPHDDVNWSAGTISFADGTTTQAILVSTGVHTGLAVGTHYVYWEYGDNTLNVTTTYSAGVATDRGIIARLTVPTDVNASMTIETIYSWGGVIGEAWLGPEFDTPATPAGWVAGDIVTSVVQASDGTTVSIFTVTVPTVTDATAYAFRYKVNGTADWHNTQSDSNVIVVEGLIAGQNYDCAAASISKLGSFSTWTATVQKVAAGDTTAPATPTNLTATNAPRGIQVDWDDNSESDLSHYEVWANIGGAGYNLIFRAKSSLFFWSVSQANTGVNVAFKVKAVDWTGNASAFSNEDTGQGVLTEPDDLAIETRPWTSDISIIWDDMTDEPPTDFNHILWGQLGDEGAGGTDATITFSGTDTHTITAGEDVGVADGDWWVYWDEDDAVLHWSHTYSDGMGAGRGVMAVVRIDNANSKPPTIIPWNSYTPTIGVGILAAHTIESVHISSDWITGKNIQTASGVGTTAAGMRMDSSGLRAYNGAFDKTFEIVASTGAAIVYGHAGGFQIYEDDGVTKLGELRGNAGTIKIQGEDGKIIQMITEDGASMTVQDDAAGDALISSGAAGDVVITGGTSIQLKTDVTPGGTAATLGTAAARFAGVNSVLGNFSGQVTIPELPLANASAASKKYVDDTVGGAASNWIDLTDTDPLNYVGEGGHFVVVNATPDGLDFTATITEASVSGHMATANTHVTLPNTIANVLSDHNAGAHSYYADADVQAYISVGTGLDWAAGVISLDLSEFTDMTAAVDGTVDELILLDAGAERRKRVVEINLSEFNDDLGYVSYTDADVDAHIGTPDPGLDYTGGVFTIDLEEFTTVVPVASDYLIFLDSGTGNIERKNLISNFSVNWFDVTGTLDMSLNAIDNVSNITLGEYIYHDGDTNTYIRFKTDEIDIYCGGVIMARFEEDATDSVRLYYNGSEVLRTMVGGVYLGADSNAQIYENGGSLYLDSDTSIIIAEEMIPSGSRDLGLTGSRWANIWGTNVRGNNAYFDDAEIDDRLQIPVGANMYT